MFGGALCTILCRKCGANVMRQRYQESPNKASTVNYAQMQLQVDQEALDSGEGIHIHVQCHIIIINMWLNC